MSRVQSDRSMRVAWLHADQLAGNFAGELAAPPSAARPVGHCHLPRGQSDILCTSDRLTLTDVNSQISDPRCMTAWRSLSGPVRSLSAPSYDTVGSVRQLPQVEVPHQSSRRSKGQSNLTMIKAVVLVIAQPGGV